MNTNLFSPRNTNAIAATSTSQARLLPSAGAGQDVGGPTAVFYNAGAGTAFICVGPDANLTAVAPTVSTNVGTGGHMPLPTGALIPIQLAPTDKYWAVVSGTTASVYCTRGDVR